MIPEQVPQFEWRQCQSLDPPLRRTHARLRDHRHGCPALLLFVPGLLTPPIFLPELQVKGLQQLRLQSHGAVGVAAK